MSTSGVSGASNGFTYSNAFTSTVNNPNGVLNESSFLQMLLTQLKDQDPLDVQDSSQFASDLAQYSSLAGIDSLNSTTSTDMSSMNDTMTALLLMENTTQAASLIGKTVTISIKDSSGNQTGTVSGAVTSVKFENGQPEIIVNGTEYGIASVTEISS